MNFKQARLTPSETHVESATPCGPGPRLRDARLARSLTVEQAAAMLKLEPAIVAALELDDYGQLPEPLYVRGYLTSYARLLGVPEREVEVAYKSLAGESSVPVLSRGGRCVPAQARSSDTLVRSFSYLLIVAVGSLVGWWAYEHLGERSLDSALVDAKPASSFQASGSTVDQAPLSQPAHKSSETEPPRIPARVEETAVGLARAPLKTADAPRLDPAVAEGAARLSVTEIMTDSMSAEPVPRTPTSELPQPSPGVAKRPASAPVGGATGADPEPIARADRESGFGTLQLRFQRDSWLEVRDLRGERLAYGLVKAGSTRSLRGQLPFRITLGDSGAVALVLDGNVVAPEAIGAADGQPLRFTLGETQDG